MSSMRDLHPRLSLAEKGVNKCLNPASTEHRCIPTPNIREHTRSDKELAAISSILELYISANKIPSRISTYNGSYFMLHHGNRSSSHDGSDAIS